ncbi:MAG: helix-turn-helix domain-containing protein [Phycisphaeraceae bacterium JB051]
MTQPIASDNQAIRKLIRSYERATGLTSCFRPTGPVFQQLGGLTGLHVSPFCVIPRRDQMPLCRQDDAANLHEQFAQPTLPLMRTCHAGASEIIVPVHWQNQLVLVVFFGQFRQNDDQPATLPRWPEAKIKHAIQLLTSLQSHLLAIYQQRLANHPKADDPRLEQVIDWLTIHISTDPSLDALANMLCVSPTWASHLIRQLAGKPFTQLKDDIRIERAKHLLSNSPLKVASIAAQLGMDDANYFSRFFKRKTGTTASDYRKVHQVAWDV